MNRQPWHSLFHRNRNASTNYRWRRALHGFEQLEPRRVLAASAAFNFLTGALSVSDSLASPSDNNVAISFEVVGNRTLVTVTDQNIDILPLEVPASSVTSIVVATAGGNDTVSLNFVGSAQFVHLFKTPIVDGGDGDDTIIGSKLADLLFGVGGNDTILGLESSDHLYGGEGADRIFGDYGSNNAPDSGDDFLYGEAGNELLIGDQGNDTLLGFAGDDQMFGNDGDDRLFGDGGNDTLEGNAGSDRLFGDGDNDILRGGAGDDQVFGESGNDRMIWNPGDGSDLNEGGDGVDTVEVNGGNGAEDFTALANGARVQFDRVSPAPFMLDIGTSENLVVNANGGDDTFSATGNLAGLIQITVDGGAGNDTIRGGNGVDTLLGGDGTDFIDGNQGNDVAFLGAGEDRFQWDPGDGSDVVEGQEDLDTLLFNGANASENIDVSANGQRLRFFRDVANITMDLDDVERIDFNALGGADTITVNDLSGTDATQVNLNLAGTIGGNTGDDQADNVIVNATGGDDVIVATGDNGSVSVLGLAPAVNISNAEIANDRLTINALAGDDVVEGSGLSDDAILFTANGGIDDDVLVGGAGNDILNGNEGDDVLVGGPGADTLDGGPGNNTVIQ